jgi:hypothetical protein
VGRFCRRALTIGRHSYSSPIGIKEVMSVRRSVASSAITICIIVFGTIACDAADGAANKKYVTAGQRILAAQRAASPVERYKQLQEADKLIASILADHADSAVAVRIVANEKIGGLTRRQLADALDALSEDPDVCVAEPSIHSMICNAFRSIQTKVPKSAWHDPEVDSAKKLILCIWQSTAAVVQGKPLREQLFQLMRDGKFAPLHAFAQRVRQQGGLNLTADMIASRVQDAFAKSCESFCLTPPPCKMPLSFFKR